MQVLPANDDALRNDRSTPHRSGSIDADEWEKRVASLWAEANLKDSERIARMRVLVHDAPHPALSAFELGGALDSAGREAEADVQYAAAAAAGLAAVDPGRAAQMGIQHASTLRNLGRVDEAIEMLRGAPEHPLTGAARAVFLALALHSAGRCGEALQIVIETIEPALPGYHRSVREYAAALTNRRCDNASEPSTDPQICPAGPAHSQRTEAL